MIYFKPFDDFSLYDLRELRLTTNLERRAIWNWGNHLRLAPLELSKLGHTLFDKNSMMRPDVIRIE
jgi:hypothetical protein